MKLNEWYDLFFENNGKCPECGHWLIPHIGCIGWSIIPIRPKCSIYKRTRAYQEKFNKYYFNSLVIFLRKKLSYKRKKYGAGNLDIQREKTYLKTND